MKTASAMADDRMASGVFEPETVLPSQFLDRAHFGAGLRPELRLRLAVLEDAVATFQRFATATGRASERQFRAAHEWIFGDDLAWPFSFINVCHALGLEPQYLRRGLTEWLATIRGEAAGGKVIPFRYQFRRVGGSRTRAVVPRALRG